MDLKELPGRTAHFAVEWKGSKWLLCSGSPITPSWSSAGRRSPATCWPSRPCRSVVSDATWQALAGHYSTEQLIDAVFTVGQYNMVSWALNSFGVPLDDFLPGAKR